MKARKRKLTKVKFGRLGMGDRFYFSKGDTQRWVKIRTRYCFLQHVDARKSGSTAKHLTATKEVDDNQTVYKVTE